VPDRDGELTQMQAATIRALASPHRLRIVGLLRSGPREVNEIARHLDAAQATVSQHLAVMRAAGLVEATRDGRLVSYRLADPEIGDACDVMRRTIVRRLPAAPTTSDHAIDPTPAQVTHA
jgi:DNA-binding transcriptional ArsR family regulator